MRVIRWSNYKIESYWPAIRNPVILYKVTHLPTGIVGEASGKRMMVARQAALEQCWKRLKEAGFEDFDFT